MKKNKNNSERLVYSTDSGRVCPECERPVPECVCSSKKGPPKGDGVVRVRRESKGRKGKTVTVVTGVPLAEDDLKELSKKLKAQCGTGGTVKDGNIEIQGDHRDLLIRALINQGFEAKGSGG